MHTPFLIGERLYLRALQKGDLPHVRTWSNDPEVRRLTGEVTPMSEEAAESFYERLQKDESRIWFAIVLKENDRIVGECGLLRMFHPWRTTDLTMILGERDVRGQGYGTEAIRLLMDYAFGYLGFHRISIGVVGFNERALQFYESVGFRREGIQRDGYYYDHAFSDFVMLSILEEEFRALHRPERGEGA